MGRFTIKAEWEGNQTHYGTSSVTTVEVLTNPTILSIHLSSSSSDVGLKVSIGGSLTSNNAGFSGIPVLLSYSVTGGKTWNEISQVTTASDGSYSAIWMPSATGEYIVKATWSGNSTILGATATVDLAVIPFDQKSVFSITSNSTISALSFNSESRELSFTVTGPSETFGYIDVYIAKTLIPNVANIKAYLDGNPIDYTVTSSDDSYILHFTYSHSAHTVIIRLNANAFLFETPLGTLALIGIAIVVVGIIIIFVMKKRRTK